MELKDYVERVEAVFERDRPYISDPERESFEGVLSFCHTVLGTEGISKEGIKDIIKNTIKENYPDLVDEINEGTYLWIASQCHSLWQAWLVKVMVERIIKVIDMWDIENKLDDIDKQDIAAAIVAEIKDVGSKENRRQDD